MSEILVVSGHTDLENSFVNKIILGELKKHSFLPLKFTFLNLLANKATCLASVATHVCSYLWIGTH